jgi:hypothetical protein
VARSVAASQVRYYFASRAARLKRRSVGRTEAHSLSRTTDLTCIIASLVTVGVSLFAIEQTGVAIVAIGTAIIVIAFAVVTVIMAIVRHRPFLRTIAAVFCALLVIGSVARWSWPLRAGYAFSRKAFERDAAEVRGGHSFKNHHVGVFYIQIAEVSPSGIVCFWVDTNSAGRTGFVQTLPQHIPFNLWSTINLDERWQFISED